MYTKHFVRIILFIICFTHYVGGYADPYFHVIEDDKNEYEFQDKNVLLYLDTSKALTINEVKYANFVPFNGSFLNSDTKSAYWLTFPLKSTSTKERKWILEILDAHQEKVDVYFFRHDLLIEKTFTGQKRRVGKREYSHKNHIIDVPLKANDRLMVYMRFECSRVGSMIFKIRSNGNYSSYAFKEYYILGLYYGILVLICLVNLILYIFLKEKIYIIYLLYVFSWMIASLNEDGIGQHLFWANQFWFERLVFQFIQPLLIIFYVWYSIEFFSKGQLKTTNNKIIIFSTGLYLLVYSVELITGQQFQITTWLMFIPLVKILINAFKTYKMGYTPAQFFILGNLFIIFGLFIRFLQDQYVIKFVSYYSVPAIMVVYSKNIGMVLEIITLTVALGDRFRFFKKRNEEQREKLMNGYIERERLQEKVIIHLQENEELSHKVNKELEQKVQERTQELQTKSNELEGLNAKLLEQSEQINEMNRLLDLDNYKLKKQVNEVNSSRVNFKKISYSEFEKLYPNRFSVLRFLNENKWKEGYTCRKCNNTKYCDGNSKFSRRCTKCRYDESITAFTIFHKCKFPLEHALYIVSKTVRHGNDLDIQETSEELGLRKNTVRNFKTKVVQTLEKNKNVKGQDDILVAVILNPYQEG